VDSHTPLRFCCAAATSARTLREKKRLDHIDFYVSYDNRPGPIIGARYGFSLLLSGMTGPDSCLSEEWKDIPNLSGLKFEVEYTNCDTLAKDEAVSVYVAEPQGKSSSPSDWNRRTLVFRYDPGGARSSPPSIGASGNHRILISVQDVSSVIFQRRNWRDISIDYRIAHKMNP